MLTRLVKRICAILIKAGKKDIDSTDPGQKGLIPISPNLQSNERYIRNAFGNSSDLVFRRIDPCGYRVLVAHIDGLVDTQAVSENVLRQINRLSSVHPPSIRVFQDVLENTITTTQVQKINNMVDLLNRISRGHTVIIIHGLDRALACDMKHWHERQVDEAKGEATIRGSREGFVENIRTNTTLIRRRITDPRLWIKQLDLGSISHTQVAFAYIKGVARDELVNEVEKRLNTIETDSIQESGHLEELFEDAPWSPFPTLLRTERLDRVVGALFEGRLAIITDGTPFVLIAPVSFHTFLVASEDYFERWVAGSLLRPFRMVVFLVSLFLPALYVAITSYHHEMLPTTLLLRLAGQREGVPFPAVAEALLMEVIFELLREAGIRLPRIIGPAISIVGVLIIGQTAVDVGLVSPTMVIVVALTAIASFATPGFSLAVTTRILRFPVMLLAGTLGLFGVFWGALAVLAHLVTLRSLGVPYLAPLAPTVVSEMKDVLFRAPWWAMDTRPEFISGTREKRQPPDTMPKPTNPRNMGGREP